MLSLTEDIALTDPHIYISGPINDITYKLGDLVDLVEDRSLGFLNTMDAIARSTRGSASGELYVSYNCFISLRFSTFV